MKKIIFALILSSITFTSYSQFGTTTGIGYDWSELSEDDKQTLENRANLYINLLRKKDIKGFYDSCHTKFKEFVPEISFTELGGLMGDLVARSETPKFKIGKKVTFNNAPTSGQFATGGSLDQTAVDYLQFIAVAGIKEQAILVFDLGGSPLRKAIIIKLGLEGSQFKLIAIDMSTTSFNGKNAGHYLNLSESWSAPNQKICKYIALNMAYRLSYLGQGNLGSTGVKVTTELQTLQMDTAFIKTARNWKFDETTYSVINYDFIETQNDLTPNIMYITSEKLSEKPITKEAQNLYSFLSQGTPAFKDEFSIVMFQAYQEFPALKTKEYKYYRAIVKGKK